MQLRKYTLEQLQAAVETSQSVAQVLSKLNVAAYGGNYKTFQNAVSHYNIDISHFTGQGWNKGQNFGPKRPIEDYLNNIQTIQSYKLKNRLIRESLIENKCNSCNNTTWLNQPIALELHHIDGNNANNNLNNLEVLCPNCHAFTDNYRGKNQDRAQ